MKCVLFLVCVAVAALATPTNARADSRTFAERLGWGAEDRVLIFHNDDAGMSHESNLGTIEGFENGLLTSCSTMMPCSWVPEFAAFLKGRPDIDNGLHLTLTSEWKGYRWAPVAGRDAVPGLVDAQGYMHRGVREVVANASADEVEKEIRAQIALAEKLGMPFTHLDSHMGTLFASPAFFERYVAIGIELGVPIMIMGKSTLEAEQRALAEQLGLDDIVARIWDAGLPVLDHLFTSTADTGDPEEMVEALIARLRGLPPGVSQIILHATRPGANFSAISGSGHRREAELEMVLSDRVRQVIEEEGIILTTYRELLERRRQAAEDQR